MNRRTGTEAQEQGLSDRDRGTRTDIRKGTSEGLKTCLQWTD